MPQNVTMTDSRLTEISENSGKRERERKLHHYNAFIYTERGKYQEISSLIINPDGDVNVFTEGQDDPYIRCRDISLQHTGVKLMEEVSGSGASSGKT